MKTLSAISNTVHYVTPLVMRYYFLIQQFYLRDIMPRHWSPGGLPQMPRTWKSISYTQTFSWGVSCTTSSTLQLGELNASVRDIVSEQLLI